LILLDNFKNRQIFHNNNDLRKLLFLN